MEGLLVSEGGIDPDLDQLAYTPLGQPLRATFGVSGNQVSRFYNIDPATNRLIGSSTSAQIPGGSSDTADSVSYTYDQAGNLTSSSDAQDTGGTQTQCFQYNHLDEISTAWTDSGGTTTASAPSVPAIGGCTNTTPSATSLGGPAESWENWTYNLLGDRTSQVSHNTSGNSALDVTQTLSYPTGAAPAEPNAPTAIQTQYGTSGSSDTTTVAYDNAGDTQSQSTATSGASPPPAPPAESGITYTRKAGPTRSPLAGRRPPTPTTPAGTCSCRPTRRLVPPPLPRSCTPTAGPRN